MANRIETGLQIKGLNTDTNALHVSGNTKIDVITSGNTDGLIINNISGTTRSQIVLNSDDTFLWRFGLTSGTGNTSFNFFNGTNDVLTINRNLEQVGVGVNPTTFGTQAKFHINNTTSGNTFLAEDSTNPDATPFVIDASGNTGIGTASPSANLHIFTSLPDSLWIERNSAANAHIRYKNSATQMWAGLSPAGNFAIGDGIDLTNSSLLTVVNSSGNVGIGTTSPTAKLHITNTGSSNSFLVEDDTNPDSTPFVIDASGNTGIGTTTPEFKLDALGSVGRFYVSLDNQTTVATSLSGSSSGQTDISVVSPGSGLLQLGIIGSNFTGTTFAGKVKDSYIYSSVANNGLNLVSAPGGGGFDDYIRFYAGQFGQTGNTPDIHIQGSGATRGYVGINTSTVDYLFDVRGTNSRFYFDPTSSGGVLALSGNSGVPRLDVGVPGYLTNPPVGVGFGARAWDDAVFTTYGNLGDAFFRASQDSPGLNIINAPGSSTPDYIRFYAGQTASSGNTPDIHIQGSGSTRGYVGIGTGSPTSKLNISGSTGFLNYDSDGVLDASRQSYLKVSTPSASATTAMVVNSGDYSLEFLTIGTGTTTTYGSSGDSVIYASSLVKNLNIINGVGPGPDNIRFYAGQIVSTGTTPDLHIQGNGVTRGYVGIGTTNPSEKLHVSGNTLVDGISILRYGNFSFNGTNTDAGTYTNQWQKVCSFGTPASAFDYSAFVIRVDVGGNTTNLNTSADVYISYKQQSGSWYVYANIINYGRTPLITDNFDILLNTSAETITVYHKLTQDYDTPSYTYIGYTPAGLINYGTVVGTSLSGETSNSWTQKFITNGLTSAVNTGYLGVGTTSPTAQLHVIGNTLISSGMSASTVTITNPYVPTGSTDPTGTAGTISWSGNTLYFKNNTGWVRITGQTSW